MISIADSTRSYEAWLRDQLGRELVQADLARKHDRMRESAFAFLRATYWRWAETILSVCPDLASVPPVLATDRYHAALAAALPDPGAAFVAFSRTAGTGSLGRPRYVAVADWRGGPVVRECKVILPSAWTVFAEGAAGPILAANIAGAATRAVDPHYRVADGLVVRRLSPNSRKIEVDDAGDVLVSPDMLRLMGREIAGCHAGDAKHLGAVRQNAAGRDAHWLEKRAREAAQAVRQDFAAFA